MRKNDNRTTTGQTQLKAPSNSTVGSAPCASPREENARVQERLAAKAHWKNQPDHRYTPKQLKRMAAADVTIHGRKRIVMRY